MIPNSKTYEFGPENEKVSVLILDSLYEQNIMGMVTSSLMQENLPLVFSEPDEDELLSGALGVGAGGKVPRIILYMDNLGLFEDDLDKWMFVIFHELGHYIHLDHLNTAQYDEERIAATKNGEVLPMEISADAFAVKYLGREMVLSGMETLKKEVENWMETEIRHLCIREIETRIDIIKGEKS